MGRGRSKKSSGGGSTTAANFQILNANTAPTVQAAQSANNSAFPATDPNGYHDLYNGRQYFANQNLTIDQQLAVVNYLSDTPEPGSLYSMSQNMNTAMATGQKLTPNQQYVHDNLMGAMHNLGYNVNLTRYDHASMVDSLLAQAGLTKGYQNYTQKQLQQALTGATFTENKFLSTSYNGFKNAPQSSKSVFESRAVKINYKAKASTQAMMPGNGPGGALGEILVAPNQSMKVVGVRFNGNKARRQGTQSYNLPQIEIDVELG